MLGLKGPTVAAEGCSSPQELEKAGRRAAIFLVELKDQRGEIILIGLMIVSSERLS